jgi:hypothetical protein
MRGDCARVSLQRFDTRKGLSLEAGEDNVALSLRDVAVSLRGDGFSDDSGALRETLGRCHRPSSRSARQLVVVTVTEAVSKAWWPGSLPRLGHLIRRESARRHLAVRGSHAVTLSGSIGRRGR